ncbi:MAG: phosphoenolpyruvate--protein phosphotransferase [Candidatus Polarisedimenticolaceae bacterium]|nr:phosphoenolpyruvate--protein phosphotransferase [Candidatus Polarisedimenticolaceae bacterium]
MSLLCSGIGVGVSRAIAIGPAHLLKSGLIEVQPSTISAKQIDAECESFLQAIKLARRQLKAVRNKIPASTPSDISAFIDTHLLMLEDSALAEAPLELVRIHCLSAAYALQVKRDALVKVFDEMDDPYLRTRKDDVDHVVNQIQKNLRNLGMDVTSTPDLQGRIIIASDLTPADAILMGNRGVAAFITEYGSPMSHTAILARSLGIPTIVGVHNATRYLQQDETLIVDSEQGIVLADPSWDIIEHFNQRIVQQRYHEAELQQLVNKPSRTLDKTAISLQANIELPEDIDATLTNGAVGVGLYRTEFLFMNRQQLPDEAEHYATYKRVTDGLNGIPVTIRTLDLGADKQTEEGAGLCTPSACNPALGLRAIRLCLKEPELFKPQLRAILRVAADAPVRMLIPMLSSMHELNAVKQLIEEVKQELTKEGLSFNPNIPLGAMIEVPAAALSADAFAKALDFFSIGTNDLIQYTLAIDRIDDEVSHLFDPLHPSVLRLIKMTIDAANRHKIPVSMCGEMAGDPRYTRLLLGLGLREFSMQPGALLEVKKIVRESDLPQLIRRTEQFIKQIDEGPADKLWAMLASGLE